MTTDRRSERAALLGRLARGPALVADAARRASAAADAPDAPLPPPGAWSPREVVAHLVNVESVVFWVRLDQLAAGESPVWPWTEPGPSDDPAAATLDGALGLLAACRAGTIARIETLDDEGWGRAGAHVTYGRLDVAGLLGVVIDHEDEHLSELEARARAPSLDRARGHRPRPGGRSRARPNRSLRPRAARRPAPRSTCAGCRAG